MSEREWRFYLDDMIGFVEKVMAYTQSLIPRLISINEPSRRPC